MLNLLNDIKWMKVAMYQAQQAERLGEVPVGAIIVLNNVMVGHGYNRQGYKGLLISHAEIMAIVDASIKMNTWNLEGGVMYVTLEPCPMCLGALMNSRVYRLVYAASQNYIHHNLPEKVQVRSGILQEEAIDLLEKFFRKLRRK